MTFGFLGVPTAKRGTQHSLSLSLPLPLHLCATMNVRNNLLVLAAREHAVTHDYTCTHDMQPSEAGTRTEIHPSSASVPADFISAITAQQQTSLFYRNFESSLRQN